MLRFIKHNLSTIDGVSIYPLISLLIFTLFFAIVLYRVLRMSKVQVAELSNIPIDSVENTDVDPNKSSLN